jgi:hypothetical protein
MSATATASDVPVTVRELEPAEVPDTAPTDVAPPPDSEPPTDNPTPSMTPTALADGTSDQPSVPAGTDLQVASLGPDVVQQLGAQYLAIQVTRTDGDNAGAAWVKADIDASSFATTAGANYLSRLHVVAYPACVLTTPDDPDCSTATSLPSKADPTAQTVSAAVPVSPTGDAVVSGAVARGAAAFRDAVYRRGTARAELVAGGGGGVVLAVASGAAGPGGDWAADNGYEVVACRCGTTHLCGLR